MKKYNITGMSCAACSQRVEKAVAALEHVSSCSVNLLTNSMTVEGDATEESIIAAVRAARLIHRCVAVWIRRESPCVTIYANIFSHIRSPAGYFFFPAGTSLDVYVFKTEINSNCGVEVIVEFIICKTKEYT